MRSKAMGVGDDISGRQLAFTFYLIVLFDGWFGQVTSIMAGLYLIDLRTRRLDKRPATRWRNDRSEQELSSRDFCKRCDRRSNFGSGRILLVAEQMTSVYPAQAGRSKGDTCQHALSSHLLATQAPERHTQRLLEPFVMSATGSNHSRPHVDRYRITHTEPRVPTPDLTCRSASLYD